MATTPKKTNMVLDSTNAPNILNTLAADIGIDKLAIQIGDIIQDGSGGTRVATSQDSLDSLRAIGSIVTNFEAHKNNFIDALVNRIAKVIISSKMYQNPWSVFKKGILDLGESIEEVFVGLTKVEQFSSSKAEYDVFRRNFPDVKSQFHNLNYQKKYPITVSNDELRTAFLSWQGITDLIGRIIEQVYASAQYDEYIVMKYMIQRAALDGKITPVSIPAVERINALQITEDITKIIKKLPFKSRNFNYANVRTETPMSQIYNILDTDLTTILDINVLAFAFNEEKATLIGRIIGTDGFGVIDEDRLAEIFEDDPYTLYTPFTDDEKTALKSLYGVVCDKDWMRIYTNLETMTDMKNPSGLYWNYWYHVWMTFSTSIFKQVFAITTTPSAVTSVSITPDTATVSIGQRITIVADTVTTGFIDKRVTFTITDAAGVPNNIVVDKQEGNTITLIVPKNYTPGSTFTVTATANADNTKTATGTYTVS